MTSNNTKQYHIEMIYKPFPKTINQTLVGGFNPSEKYEFVSWDDYSQYMESHKIHVPDHQPETVSRPTKIHRTSPTHIHQPSVTEDLGRALGCQQNCRHWRPCPVRGGDMTGESDGKMGAIHVCS